MRLLPLLAVTAALLVAPCAHADGSFTSSDPLLNRIWAASVKTATDMLAPGPLAVDYAGDPCAIDEPVVMMPPAPSGNPNTSRHHAITCRST